MSSRGLTAALRQDTANSPRRRGRSNQVRQTVDRAGQRTVAVHREREAVEERVLGVLDARFQQVDDRVFAQEVLCESFLSPASDSFYFLSVQHISSPVRVFGARGWIILSSPTVR